MSADLMTNIVMYIALGCQLLLNVQTFW